MKKLKGDYNSETTYDVGDVVILENNVYWLQNPCAAGTSPKDSRYWGYLNQEASEMVVMLADTIADLYDSVATLTAAVATIPKNIDDESIVLKSGDDEYLITVDATGDTPELAVELIEEESDEDAGEGD